MKPCEAASLDEHTAADAIEAAKPAQQRRQEAVAPPPPAAGDPPHPQHHTREPSAAAELAWKRSPPIHAAPDDHAALDRSPEALLTASLRAWLVKGGYEAAGLPVNTLLELVQPARIVVETNPGSTRYPQLQLAMSIWVLWFTLAVSACAVPAVG